MKYKNLSEASRYAWNTTFVPFHKDYPERFRFVHYFLGFPPISHTQFIEIFFYFLFCGFIFTPLKNLVKMVTEFPLAWLKHTLKHLEKSLGERSFLTILPYIALKTLSTVLAPIYFLVRTITSPVTSAREAAKYHPLFGFFSILCSIAGLIALTIVLAPAIAGLASSLGLTSLLTTIGATPGLSPLASVIVFALQQIGIPLSAPLIGASILAAFAAIIHTVNSIREYCTELLSIPRYVVSLNEVDMAGAPNSWVSMIEFGLTDCCRKEINADALHYSRICTKDKDEGKIKTPEATPAITNLITL